MRKFIFLACMAVMAGASGAQPVQPPQTWTTCAACHGSGASAIGPSLIGVSGRRAGSVPGFGYSRAMKNAGITWDDASLSAFLKDPQQAVPGNRMPFPGVADAGEVAALVKYLKTLN